MRLNNLSAANPTNPRWELRAVGDGIAGVRDTLRAMAQIAREAQADPTVVYQAHQIIEHCPNHGPLCNARAVQWWVREHVRYVPDPRDLEAVKTPDVILQSRAGDCDDQATLVAALLLALGITPRFIVAATTPSREYDHVYAEAAIPGAGWLSVETTEPVGVGWRPKMYARPIIQAI